MARPDERPGNACLENTAAPNPQEPRLKPVAFTPRLKRSQRSDENTHTARQINATLARAALMLCHTGAMVLAEYIPTGDAFLLWKLDLNHI
jgi:hypothetical protein